MTRVNNRNTVPSVVMLTNDRQIDRRILLEADSLEARGWQVTILAMPTDEPADDDPRVVRLGSEVTLNHRETALLGGYRTLRRLLAMNSRLMQAAKAFAWRWLADREKFYVDLFLPTVLQYRPTVFLAHDLPMLPVGAAAAEATGAALAYDSHELYPEQEFPLGERRMWAEIEKKHIRRAAIVTTVNPSIAREMERRYGLERVGVIHNAERPLPERARRRWLHDKLGLRNTERTVLFQGGLNATRNLMTLVKGMAWVEDPGIHLVFLGDGTYRHTLKAAAQRLGIASRVHFLNAVPQRELLEHTSSADLGIIPYVANCLNTELCTPNKLFEFIAAGVPILASDLPELRRIVTGYGIGAVADLSDAAAIGRAIRETFGDPATIEGWRSAMAHAQAELNWSIEGKRFADLFERFREPSATTDGQTSEPVTPRRMTGA